MYEALSEDQPCYSIVRTCETILLTIIQREIIIKTTLIIADAKLLFSSQQTYIWLP